MLAKSNECIGVKLKKAPGKELQLCDELPSSCIPRHFVAQHGGESLAIAAEAWHLPHTVTTNACVPGPKNSLIEVQLLRKSWPNANLYRTGIITEFLSTRRDITPNKVILAPTVDMSTRHI